MKSYDKLHIGLPQVDLIRAADHGVRSENELGMDLDEGIMLRWIKFLLWLRISASL